MWPYHAREFVSILGVVDGLRASSQHVNILTGQIHRNILCQLTTHANHNTLG